MYSILYIPRPEPFSIRVILFCVMSTATRFWLLVDRSLVGNLIKEPFELRGFLFRREELGMEV